MMLQAEHKIWPETARDCARLRRLTEEEKRGSRGRRNKPQQASTPARQDAADGDGVEVTAFTEFEGRPGPNEQEVVYVCHNFYI